MDGWKHAGMHAGSATFWYAAWQSMNGCADRSCLFRPREGPNFVSFFFLLCVCTSACLLVCLSACYSVRFSSRFYRLAFLFIWVLSIGGGYPLRAWTALTWFLT